MARRVYLHIGTMKSATTYIQQLCELNKDYLHGCGVQWPSEDLRYQAVRDLFGRPPQGVDFTGAWQLLAREMRRYDGDVVVSNELLAALHPGHIRRLVKAVSKASELEPHVVLTARDHARLIPSHWQTTIKNGRTHTWSQFAAAVCEESSDAEAQRIHDWFWQRHDLVAIMARWQRYVPLERLTLVTVPPPGGDREGVARRFGAALGIDLVGLTQPEIWTNLSLGAYSAELMRRVNEQTVDIDRPERSHGYRGALGGALAQHADKEPAFALSRRQQDWVRARTQAATSEMEALGVRVEGDLADLVPLESPPTGLVDPEDASEAELLAAAVRGLMGMARTVTEQTVLRKETVAELSAAEQRVSRLQHLADRQRARLDKAGAPARPPRRTPARTASQTARARAFVAFARRPVSVVGRVVDRLRHR